MKTRKKIFRQSIYVWLVITATSAWSEPGWVKINWENDVFFQTDRYFTNGMSLHYQVMATDNALFKSFHLPRGNANRVMTEWHLKQNIYTPQFKTSPRPLPGDRAFASFLLVGNRQTVIYPEDRLIRYSEIEIGLLGKSSGGELVQNGIHDLLPTSSHVSGWENQIGTEPLFTYGIGLQKALFQKQYLAVHGLIDFRAGTPVTDISAGIAIQTGMIEGYFEGPNRNHTDAWQVYHTFKFKGKAVAYDATIQGGLFSPVKGGSPLPFVLEYESGLNFRYKSSVMELGWKFVSPEISGGLTHRWGYLSFEFAL